MISVTFEVVAKDEVLLRKFCCPIVDIYIYISETERGACLYLAHLYVDIVDVKPESELIFWGFGILRRVSVRCGGSRCLSSWNLMQSTKWS